MDYAWSITPFQATWYKGDKELKPGAKYDMEVTPKHAILTVKKASKKDDGPYRVVMENNLGKDDAEVKAKIKGTHGNTFFARLTDMQ